MEQEISVLRRELHNVRNQMRGLRADHKKDVEAIKRELANTTSNAAKVVESPVEEDVSYRLRPIGRVKTWHETKNGTPRQSSISTLDRGIIDVTDLNGFDGVENAQYALENLHEFSHVWLIFLFDQNGAPFSKTKVAPPRLKGQRVGLFSTRSPHRPNPIGLTLARLEKVEGTRLYVSGLDLLSGTPIVDIKPYIPHYDSPVVTTSTTSSAEKEEIRIPEWITSTPKLTVTFTQQAMENVHKFSKDFNSDFKLDLLDDWQQLRDAIVDVLCADPRSNYRREKCTDRLYYVQVDTAHITCWFDRDDQDQIETVQVLKVKPK